MVDGDGNTSRKLAVAGVESCIAKKHLTHQDYVDCVHQVEGKETCSVIQTYIRSFRHKLFVNQQNKVDLL